MREIKFRFWLTEEKKIKMGYDEVKYISADNPKNCIDEVHINPFNYRIPEQAIIMQYTGLKDKNGNDIYEADILSDDNKQIHIVKFIDSVSCFCIAINNEDCHLALYCYNKDSIIIGNIYENPELLNNTAG